MPQKFKPVDEYFRREIEEKQFKQEVSIDLTLGELGIKYLGNGQFWLLKKELQQDVITAIMRINLVARESGNHHDFLRNLIEQKHKRAN
jgi:demethoxyubiquinone hydroxylase (CLK1/Coq7/Cat5 family)